MDAMYILHKYLIREISRHFLLIMGIVIAIYTIVDFFERIDNFMEANASLLSALAFMMFRIPFIAAQMLPAVLLLSVLVTLGLMSKRNELVALKSSGIGIYTLFKPIAIIGVVGGILLFFLSEVIVPISVAKANAIYLTDVKKISAMATKEKNIWIKGKRTITHITFYNQLNHTVFGVTLHQFNDQFKLVRRVDAPKGIFVNGHWVLYFVMEQTIDPATNAVKVTFYTKKTEPVDLLPEDLKRVAKKSDEMSYEELRNYISAIEAEGYNADNYRVDLHAKTALPFVCLIMCMVGTGIAVRRALKESLAKIITLGVAIIFLYWVLFSFCLSLGHGGILPPVLAAWLANLVFFCLGGILLLHAD
jgi:lipopolysaccharide export system permease protein